MRTIRPRYPSQDKINLGLASGKDKEIINVPNAVSIAGYASTIAWLMGAHPAFAIAGIVADEIDGPIARKTGQTTDYGSLLDWGIDLTLTGAVAMKVGLAPLLLAITPVQIWMRQNDIAPTFGSARAALTVYGLLK